MWSSVLTVAALLALAAGSCYKQEEEYYSELGCKPGPAGLDNCPTSYTCSGRSQYKCQYLGELYDAGHSLDLSGDCLANCYCTTSPLNNMTAFTCVGIDCPENFNRPPPPNCYGIYEHGKCCRVEEICIDPTAPTSGPVCKHNGLVYQVGQRFDVSEECKQCICQPGFNGSFVEPFCRSITCNLELLYGFYVSDGCVPVYYGETDCCPTGWRCPEISDTVVPKSDNMEPSIEKELTCQFGEMNMHVGDVLSPSVQWPGARCECRVPPHPICVLNHPVGN